MSAKQEIAELIARRDELLIQASRLDGDIDRIKRDALARWLAAHPECVTGETVPVTVRGGNKVAPSVADGRVTGYRVSERAGDLAVLREVTYQHPRHGRRVIYETVGEIE